jgi:AraC-like DNA-binding protein
VDPPARSAVLHDPLATLQVQPLHRSASISVFDVRCRPHDFERGPEEWSRTHQIVFPRRGVFECELRGQKLIADAHRVLFFNREESYRVAHPARCGDECTVLTFPEELLQAALAELEPAQLDRATPCFRFAQALTEPELFALQAALLLACRSAGEPGPTEPLALDEVALVLLERLLLAAYRQRQLSVPRRQRASTTELHRQQVERAQVLLATRFADPLSLDTIARAAACSPFHLARIFRRHSGLSLHQYRQRLRLREALRRLVEGKEELSKLALELGFASHSHFTDAFRLAYGLPPSACQGRLGARRLAEVSQRLPVAAD